MNPQQELNQELYCAIQCGDVQQVRVLIEHGADVNGCSSNGFTPLRVASLFGGAEVASVLLEAGADPFLATSSQDNPHRAVLDVAVRNAHAEIVALLLSHGVEVSPSFLHQVRRLSERPFQHERMREVMTLLEGKATVT